jgi:8-oxo-dGTP pyrophosphatase MutT (NUDIX family)
MLQRGPAAKFGQGLWDLPVGKSDPGEPITWTAVRELREETGLIVDPAGLELAQVVHGADGIESLNGFLTVVFAAHEWTGELINAEPAKHAQVRWFDLDALPAPGDVVFSTRDTLTAYLAGTPGVLLDGWPG